MGWHWLLCFQARLRARVTKPSSELPQAAATPLIEMEGSCAGSGPHVSPLAQPAQESRLEVGLGGAI